MPECREQTRVVTDSDADHSEDGVDLTLIRWMLSLTPGERLPSCRIR